MKQLRILLIDDDDAPRKLSRSVLMRDATTPVLLDEASSPAEAWLRVEANAPDVVVLDLGLPKTEDGMALCALLREDARTSHALIVVVSGFDQRLVIEDASRFGADGYLAKPLAYRFLWETIAKKLGLPTNRAALTA